MLGDLADLGAVLNVLLGVTFVSLLTAVVASYRKWKSGAIVDDDAVIARLDTDNKNLRGEKAELLSELEATRRKLWRAEDNGAIWRRQLIAEGHEPREVDTDA